MSTVFDVPRAATRTIIDKVLNRGPGSGRHKEDVNYTLKVGGKHKNTLRERLDAILNGGPGSGRRKIGDAVIYHDPTDPATHDFEKEYASTVRRGDTGSSEKLTPLPGGKSGFAGSGTSYYGHNGNKFEVSRNANGKTFYGTDHVITKLGPLEAPAATA